MAVAPSLEGWEEREGEREKDQKLGIDAIVSGPEVSWKLAVKGHQQRAGRGEGGVIGFQGS